MTINSTASLILADEGSRIWPYDDATGQPPPCNGNRTWGVGHNLSVPCATSTLNLLQRAVDCQFRIDLAAADHALRYYPFYRLLNAPRLGALTDMMFNLGPAGFGKFTQMLSWLQVPNWNEAAESILDSLVAKELVDRYRRLAEIIRSGEWPSENPENAPVTATEG